MEFIRYVSLKADICIRINFRIIRQRFFIFGSIRRVPRFCRRPVWFLFSLFFLKIIVILTAVKPNPPTELLARTELAHFLSRADSGALFNTWIAEKFNAALIVTQRCNAVKSRGCKLHERHRIYVGSGTVNRIVSQSSRLFLLSLTLSSTSRALFISEGVSLYLI